MNNMIRTSYIDEIRNILPVKMKKYIDLNGILEIRLRCNQPVVAQYCNWEKIYDRVITTTQDIQQCLEYVSNYSVYAYQENIRQGFITIKGGHRVGVSGQVIEKNGHIKMQQHISFINIRTAHQVLGCADKVMPFIYKNGLAHTLIISPPGCGKTTLLRDIIRQLSNGDSKHYGRRISVIDERSEIAACYEGVPQNNMGMRTDVIDSCPKSDGMILMVRSMNPEIIAVDEIGTQSDIETLEYIISAGCVVFGTVHGKDIEEVQSKPGMNKLISSQMFSKLIVLSKNNGIGTVTCMRDLNQLLERENVY